MIARPRIKKRKISRYALTFFAWFVIILSINYRKKADKNERHLEKLDNAV